MELSKLISILGGSLSVWETVRIHRYIRNTHQQVNKNTDYCFKILHWVHMKRQFLCNVPVTTLFSAGTHRLTCRLGIFVHGFLECCGNPQCTQECGPSFSKESSSTRRSNREKQWTGTKDGRTNSKNRLNLQRCNTTTWSKCRRTPHKQLQTTTVTTNPTDTDSC